MVEALEERLKAVRQAQARAERQLARSNAQRVTQARKKDTRRKIIAGAMILAHADRNPQFKEKLWAFLDNLLDEERDRELFDLDKPSSIPPRRSRPQF